MRTQQLPHDVTGLNELSISEVYPVTLIGYLLRRQGETFWDKHTKKKMYRLKTETVR